MQFIAMVLLLLSGPPAAPSSQVLRVRILEIARSREEFRADVAGRPRQFRVKDAALLRGFRKGDLVVVKVRAGAVVDVAMALVSALVLRVEGETALVRIGGRDQRFLLARKDLARRLREGQMARLEIEDRAQGRFITHAE